MTPPTPKSGAEAVPTVIRYHTWIDNGAKTCVSSEDFDRQSAELAQARALNEARCAELRDYGKTVTRLNIENKRLCALIALRAERGQAEVGGTEAKDASI